MKTPTRKGRQEREIDLASMKQDFLAAGRIIGQQGLADAFAHISIRLPQTDKMLFMPRKSPILLKEEDLFVVSLDESVHQSSLHTAVYRARNDVGAAIHTHSPHVICLSLLGRSVEPIHNYSAIFHDGVTLYGKGGQVGNQENAEKIVKALRQGKAIIQKGHGAFIVGENIQAACLLAIFLEESAKYMLEILSRGEPKPLPIQEARRIAEQTFKQSSIERAWEHFKFLALREFPLIMLL